MSPPHGPRAVVERYHDGTKHHFHAFARSLGYLDWASQPRPFREFAGSPVFPLYPAPAAPAAGYAPRACEYAGLFDGGGTGEPFTAAALGDMLRHALGLSAWKRFGASRWSLRVNPSSGNLHPTEAYVICGPVAGWAPTPAVYHYAPDRHALELRCSFDAAVWSARAEPAAGPNRQPAGRAVGSDVALVALTSIHWRESWKYGERAFRYCQHDLGHAIAALAFGAALLGWRVTLLPGWPHGDIASATGIDRDGDYVDAEREEAGCILALRRHGGARVEGAARPLVEAIRSGRWSGSANQLSEDHVQWTFIDEVASATEDDDAHVAVLEESEAEARGPDPVDHGRETEDERPEITDHAAPAPDARAVILRRRSAVAFDGRSTIDAAVFFAMLRRVMPGPHPPWNALWWTARVHLAIFVHRVDGVTPGLYLLAREPRAMARLRAACARDFLWTPAHDSLPFVCLARGDCRALAGRLSCDQEIASDGFFSLGMIADFDASLDAYGPSFYRNLFWETGAIGQVLYLEAEAAGARATGIGCFFDDPVHDVLGFQGHAFQSLYHFTVGMPVEDARLTSEPGYAWG